MPGIELEVDAAAVPWRRTEQVDEIPDEEAVLLSGARKGNRYQTERLLTLHQRSLYSLCRGILSHDEDAEDALQETYLRALRALPGFSGGSSVRTWLTRIAINVCLDNKRVHRRSTSIDENFGLTSPSPEAEVSRGQMLEGALSRLMPRHRTILLLKEIEGWSVTDIARALRCTNRRIYHELSIAHTLLAEWRAQYEQEGE